MQYQAGVEAKLDIVTLWHDWFSGWSIPNTCYITHIKALYITTIGKWLYHVTTLSLAQVATQAKTMRDEVNW